MREKYVRVPCFTDKRGAILKLIELGTRFNIVSSRKGAFRAGDVHPNTQSNFIISGKVKVTRHVGSDGGYDFPSIYEAGQCFSTSRDIPHLFEFLEDTVMVELWDGPFSAEYYAPYRKIVEESMK